MTTTDPAWLTQAEAEYAKKQQETIGQKVLKSRSLAARINEALHVMGVQPITPASIAGDGGVSPAYLVEPDPGQELYGVYAGWDETNSDIALLVSDYEDARNAFRGMRHALFLHDRRDIADARHTGPSGGRPSHRARSLRAIADEGTRLDADSVDPTQYALGSLTAAVLLLVDQRAGSSRS